MSASSSVFALKKGFTLIELVLVIALLGILAVSALPGLFTTNLNNARAASMNATVGAIQSGIATYAATQASGGNNITYPTTLDGAAAGTAAAGLTPLFGTVLQNGVTSQWFKVSNTCYVYDTNGNGVKDAGTTDTYFQYSTTAGTFTQVATCT